MPTDPDDDIPDAAADPESHRLRNARRRVRRKADPDEDDQGDPAGPGVEDLIDGMGE